MKSIDMATPGFFHSDNVHLSTVGKEMYILAIGEAIEKFLGDRNLKYLEH